MYLRAAVLVLLTFLASAAPLCAQEHNSFAVGVNYTQRLANDEGAHGNGGIGISWRLGHSDEGWGWTYGLGWFATDLERSVGGKTVTLGEVKVRPIVAGYGYTHRLSRRWSVTGDVVGGFAFTTFDISPEADEALRAEARADRLDTHIGAVPIVRPEVKAWYDLNRKWGLQLNTWYVLARPKVTITTPVSQETLHVRADTFSVSAGIVYRIF
jgi:hypothetical protein